MIVDARAIGIQQAKYPWENRHKNAVLVEMDKYPIFSEFTEYFLDEGSGMVTG